MIMAWSEDRLLTDFSGHPPDRPKMEHPGKRRQAKIGKEFPCCGCSILGHSLLGIGSGSGRVP